MILLLKNILQSKKIVILGFGKEGKSTFHFFKKHLPHQRLIIADKNKEAFEEIQHYDNIEFFSGDNYLRACYKGDMIIKSPGINIAQNDCKAIISSQTDLFLQYFHNQTIGITGTKGKSTTSSLIYHIIKQQTNNVLLVGNIGNPVFDYIDDINNETKIVYELSAHQLQYLQKAPHIAILLNLFPEHIDYFKTSEKYFNSKLNIYKLQDKQSNFIYNTTPELNGKIESYKFTNNHLWQFSFDNHNNNGAWNNNKTIYYSENNVITTFSIDKIHLQGRHNILDIMAAIIAAKISNISNENIQQGINTFCGLPFRLQFVGSYNGITYYNDSISTIPETTIEALKTLKDTYSLILGGYDRDIDYQILYTYLQSSTVKKIFFTGLAGKRMQEEYAAYKLKQQKTYYDNNFEKTVLTAKEKTKTGTICLLSPAASSYDAFRNFEERGKIFNAIIKQE